MNKMLFVKSTNEQDVVCKILQFTVKFLSGKKNVPLKMVKAGCFCFIVTAHVLKPSSPHVLSTELSSTEQSRSDRVNLCNYALPVIQNLAEILCFCEY